MIIWPILFLIGQFFQFGSSLLHDCLHDPLTENSCRDHVAFFYFDVKTKSCQLASGCAGKNTYNIVEKCEIACPSDVDYNNLPPVEEEIALVKMIQNISVVSEESHQKSGLVITDDPLSQYCQEPPLRECELFDEYYVFDPFSKQCVLKKASPCGEKYAFIEKPGCEAFCRSGFLTSTTAAMPTVNVTVSSPATGSSSVKTTVITTEKPTTTGKPSSTTIAVTTTKKPTTPASTSKSSTTVSSGTTTSGKTTKSPPADETKPPTPSTPKPLPGSSSSATGSTAKSTTNNGKPSVTPASTSKSTTEKPKPTTSKTSKTTVVTSKTTTTSGKPTPSATTNQNSSVTPSMKPTTPEKPTIGPGSSTKTTTPKPNSSMSTSPSQSSSTKSSVTTPAATTKPKPTTPNSSSSVPPPNKPTKPDGSSSTTPEQSTFSTTTRKTTTQKTTTKKTTTTTAKPSTTTTLKPTTTKPSTTTTLKPTTTKPPKYPGANPICNVPPQRAFLIIVPAYVYSTKTGKCVQLNVEATSNPKDNAFQSYEQCVNTCILNKPNPRQCIPGSEDPLSGKSNYVYDPRTRQCIKLMYGFVPGYSTLKKCQKSCDVDLTVPETTKPTTTMRPTTTTKHTTTTTKATPKPFFPGKHPSCNKMRKAGEPHHLIYSYAYDKSVGKCVINDGIVPSSNPNHNAFLNKEDCIAYCVPDDKPPRRQCLPVFQNPAYENRVWLYDPVFRRCVQLPSPAKNRTNTFYNKEMCEANCDVAKYPGKSIQCNADLDPNKVLYLGKAFYYDMDTGKCERYIRLPAGSPNKFGSYLECYHSCISENYKTEACIAQPDVGPCKMYVPRYYHNITTGRCESFVYGGCEGNANNYRSKMECQDSCAAFPPKEYDDELDICTLPKVKGQCGGNQTRYFFDYADGKCKPFKYGGCGGNGNRFLSLLDCQRSCACKDHRTTVDGNCLFMLPIQGYRYNYLTQSCEHAASTGCSRTDGFFKTKHQCLSICRPLGFIGIG